MLFYELFLFSADLFILGKIRRTGRRTQFAPTGMSFLYASVGETCGLPQNDPTVFSLSLEATSLA